MTHFIMDNNKHLVDITKVRQVEYTDKEEDTFILTLENGSEHFVNHVPYTIKGLEV